jgi:hypothetical protein
MRRAEIEEAVPDAVQEGAQPTALVRPEPERSELPARSDPHLPIDDAVKQPSQEGRKPPNHHWGCRGTAALQTRQYPRKAR